MASNLDGPEARRLAQDTRAQFNRAAQGDGAGKADKATHTHDLEPSLQDKKQGAALDKASAQKLFEQHKAHQTQQRDRNGPELGV